MGEEKAAALTIDHFSPGVNEFSNVVKSVVPPNFRASPRYCQLTPLRRVHPLR